jgi:hypothetical protein
MSKKNVNQTEMSWCLFVCFLLLHVMRLEDTINTGSYINKLSNNFPLIALEKLQRQDSTTECVSDNNNYELNNYQ